MIKWLKTRRQRIKELDAIIEEQKKRLEFHDEINGQRIRDIEEKRSVVLALDAQLASRNSELNKLISTINSLKDDWK